MNVVICSYLLVLPTNADFKLNRSVYVKHHRSLIEASEQFILAATKIWLPQRKNHGKKVLLQALMKSIS